MHHTDVGIVARVESHSVVETAGPLPYSKTMDKWRLYAELSAAGFGFIAAVMIGIWLGQWLDSVAGTRGVFTFLLLLMAISGAVYNLLRTVRKING
jgi:F0F1-type ATP synthase assembly protein I